MPPTPPQLDDPTLVAYLDAFAAGPDFRVTGRGAAAIVPAAA
jgi:hypothetical protein